jgi:hypothetical protein
MSSFRFAPDAVSGARLGFFVIISTRVMSCGSARHVSGAAEGLVNRWDFALARALPVRVIPAMLPY